MKNKGMQMLLDNMLSLKQSMLETFNRYKQPPQSEKERSQAVFRNFFLHIHSTRIHKYSLKPTYTFGLGIMAFFLFILLGVTGILLMLYYTPSIEQAYNSVKDISFVVGSGKYIRNLHRWSAHAMV
ncbi:MAG: DUF4405 domain-containing protein, partial [bacterium]|nr:DUF4405 domain-containing protein [bacterium]